MLECQSCIQFYKQFKEVSNSGMSPSHITKPTDKHEAALFYILNCATTMNWTELLTYYRQLADEISNHVSWEDYQSSAIRSKGFFCTLCKNLHALVSLTAGVFHGLSCSQGWNHKKEIPLSI